MSHFPNIGLGNNVKIHLPRLDDPPEGWCIGNEKSKGLLVVDVKPLAAPLQGFRFGQRGSILRYDILSLMPPESLEAQNSLEEVARDHLDQPEVSYEFDISNTISQSAERDGAIAGCYHLLLIANAHDQHFTSPIYPLAAEVLYPCDVLDDIERSHQKTIEDLSLYCKILLMQNLSTGYVVDSDMQAILVPYQVLADG